MSDNLPQEVWFDIFASLPVKTLLQIRSVCKPWNDMLSNPTFITSQLNRTKYTHTETLLIRHFAENGTHKREHYLLLNDNQTIRGHGVELQFPFKTRSNYQFRVVGSCNGVLCLSDDYGAEAYGIILWNPSIRKYVALPGPRVTRRTYGSYMFVLGFGFDPRRNDYKVVRVAYVKGRNGRDLVPPEVEVYSLSSGCWRSFVAGAPPYGIYGYTWMQAFVNGAVHWVGYDPCVADGDYSLIVCFDVRDEIFRAVMLPDCLTQCGMDLSPAVFGEMLSLIQIEYHGNEKHCSVWVMKEYGVIDSWTKIYNIDYFRGLQKTLGFRRNGVLLVAMRGKLFSYDPNTGHLKGLGICGDIESFHVDAYMESLVLLEGGTALLGADAVICAGGENSGEDLE